MSKEYKLCIIGFLLISVFGCTFQKHQDVYKIAVAAPQFGPYESLGLSIINGAELAVDIKNKNGGIDGKKIELLKVDDGGLVGEGTWRAKDLTKEKVLGVIGHLNSDISISASEVYSMARIPQISPGSTNPLFTERSEVRGYVFRTVGRDDQQGKTAAQFVQEKGFKKIAVLYNDRSYGQSLSSEFVKDIRGSKSNVEIIYLEKYKVGNAELPRITAQLKTKIPDLIFFAGEYGDAANLLSYLRTSGLKSTFLGSEGVFAPEFISNSKGSSEGAYVISLPQVRDEIFINLYKKKCNRELGSYSANSFDAANVLISAIERTQRRTSDMVADEISMTKDFPGLTGKISFDSKGDLTDPHFSVYQVKQGMFVLVK